MGRRIGFIGTGSMGRGMALNLIRGGHEVRLYNRTQAKADEVAKAGGIVVGSPAEAARGSEVVITMVADPAALLSVVEGPGGILESISPGTVLIDSSTVSPGTTFRVADALNRKGAAMLDAPVFGSIVEAESGELGFIVGGSPEVFESVQDVFAPMAKSVKHVGTIGMGEQAKLVFNLVIQVTLEAFNEGMALAAKAGLDPDVMLEVLHSGRARSGVSESRGPLILARDFRPLFKLRLANKDLELALESAHALDVPMPALAAVKQVFAGCMAAGQGDEDVCSLIKYVERGTGVEVRGSPPAVVE